MTSSAANPYRYRARGKHLVSVDQGLLQAVLNLVVRYSVNGLASLGLSRRNSLQLLKTVARPGKRHDAPGPVESYPVFGHIAMRVHRGYKFFDFNQGVVTKLFNCNGETDKAAAEVAASRTASAISAAPRFIAADEDLRWFSEELIRGRHATSLVSRASSDYLKYYGDIEECLVELALSQDPIRVRVDDHVGRVSSYEFQGRWKKAGCASSDIARVTDYIERVGGLLHAHCGAMEVELVPTHGDFSLVNAILTKQGLRFIDWEGIGPGILYSDLYNLMFAERYYGRTSANFVAEVQAILRQFREAISRRAPVLRQVAHQDEDVLRRLYYLERVRLLVDREVTENLVRVVTKSIGVFDEFDSLSGKLGGVNA